MIIADIDGTNTLFISRFMQDDIEQIEAPFKPRVVLYGSSTDTRTHYTQNISYESINSTATDFSDQKMDSEEWKKM